MAPYNRQVQVSVVVRVEVNMMIVDARQEYEDTSYDTLRNQQYEEDYYSGRDNWDWFQGYESADYEIEYPYWNPVEDKWEY